MYDLTKRELKILAAYLDYGTCEKAGKALKPPILAQSVKNALYLMRVKARVATNQQLVYEYGAVLRRNRRKLVA
jgi:hypothetical protein